MLRLVADKKIMTKDSIEAKIMHAGLISPAYILVTICITVESEFGW